MNLLNEKIRILTVQLSMERGKEYPNQHIIKMLQKELDNCLEVMKYGS